MELLLNTGLCNNSSDCNELAEDMALAKPGSGSLRVLPGVTICSGAPSKETIILVTLVLLITSRTYFGLFEARLFKAWGFATLP